MPKKNKQEKILFRGAQIRHIDMRVSEGMAFVRTHVRADITAELAEQFHWEIYRDGHLISGLEGATKLAGELNIEQLSFAPNGAAGNGLECSAVTAEDFQLTRKKPDNEERVETSLRFVIRSTSWQLITDFFGKMGEVDGALTLTLIAETEPLQQKLDSADAKPAPQQAKLTIAKIQ